MEGALPPWDNCTITMFFHPKEGRNYVQIRKDKQYVKTTSYARYLMETYLGRKLEKHEQVDHINDDKSDDRIENLQVLSLKENNLKAHKGRKVSYLTCYICNRRFARPTNQVSNKENPTCSRSCGGKKSRITAEENGNDKKLIKPEITFNCGYCGKLDSLKPSFYRARKKRNKYNLLFCSRGCSNKFVSEINK